MQRAHVGLPPAFFGMGRGQVILSYLPSSLLSLSNLRHSMPAPESVVLETNLGNIQLELYWDHAPRVRLLSSISGTSKEQSLARARIFNRQTCENFAQLAKRGYYNGVIFHRIIVVCPTIQCHAIGLMLFSQGFYGPGRRSDRDRQRRYQHVRSKVVRRTTSFFLCYSS
jgi:hypothetical protein